MKDLESELELECVSYLMIDSSTAMITVLETQFEPVFLWWHRKVKKERTYTGMIRDRVWTDQNGRILPGGSARAILLWAFLVRKEIERRMDLYINQL